MFDIGLIVYLQTQMEAYSIIFLVQFEFKVGIIILHYFKVGDWLCGEAVWQTKNISYGIWASVEKILLETREWQASQYRQG